MTNQQPCPGRGYSRQNPQRKIPSQRKPQPEMPLTACLRIVAAVWLVKSGTKYLSLPKNGDCPESKRVVPKNAVAVTGPGARSAAGPGSFRMRLIWRKLTQLPQSLLRWSLDKCLLWCLPPLLRFLFRRIVPYFIVRLFRGRLG